VPVTPSHASEFLSPPRRRWFVPMVGYVDDAAVIAWVLKSIAEELKDFRSWEQGT